MANSTNTPPQRAPRSSAKGSTAKGAPQREQQIYTIGSWLKDRFGEKVIKLSLDGGFTCPNRDGTVGTGGCLFCAAGAGEHASSLYAPSIQEQIEILKRKWPSASKYIAYFQSHTSTHAPVDRLQSIYQAALAQKDVIGLAIATRPDCLGEDVLDLLSHLATETFLWVELGLQTIHGDTFNRCYPLSVYDQAVDALQTRSIPVVTHLILGLPGESQQQMKETVRYVTANKDLFGLKLHLLNVVKGAPLASLYPGYTPFASLDEYVQLVCDLLEIIPQTVTIHRLTGDVPYKDLIAPSWSYKKRTILNEIVREMKRRGSYQGIAIP